jgi:hypothetical protein
MTTSTRRAVIRTGAWAVPAVAAAATAPAYASVSQSCCVSLVGVVCACRDRACRGSRHGAPATYTVSLQFNACECTSVLVLGWDMTGTSAESVSPRSVELGRGESTVSFTVREQGVPGATLTLSYSVDGQVRTDTVPLGLVGRCAPDTEL